ncbi:MULTISPECIES: phage head closure protein [unclassified Pseudomonas]|uniref:phage head closure protein n=1 Tax=unclassified Pseudomonas TaxID=196821 RepID=UPI000C8694F6|nr:MULTISPECIES: phage head closure protein [unclassified Pseudomonas]PMV79621.1 head-tail adaptor protein [Pseudomonas sp. GW101-1A09]PMV86876.1 head-tail adaptor protein [Pseudomonas sp. FW306-2-2C-B10A]PMV98354.1 head-tail adaptor protein [Pseudomonas sp. GW460-C8]PMV99001.1 head-tail adaptor protein [Pseudomonas sp. MPR-TSA4]PMW07023.1 head-tail adaptor protein [Pseudomonas sp. FW306-2-1A-C05A]
MRAGKLRNRITIESPVYVQDPATGEMVRTWVEAWAKVPSSIEPLSAREFITAAAEQSKVSARIVIRYRPGVNATMRILHRDKIYVIEGVLADRESGLEYLTLPCSEGVSDG